MSEEDDLGSIIFGWVGTAISFVFYIAPVVPYLKLIKGEITLKESPGLLLFCSFLNCILWSDYGLLTNKFSVYFANGIGGAITLIFLTIFLIHLAERKILYSLLYLFFLIACVVEIYFLCYYIVSPDITAILANIFNVLMYAAPGEKIYTICKNGNYKLIPIWSTLGGLACSTSWMVYGIYKDDKYLIIPNALGCASAIVQLIVFIVYRKKYFNKMNNKKNEENDENKLISGRESSE
jgi:solute carrier family 50 protein (sugar transporter)